MSVRTLPSGKQLPRTPLIGPDRRPHAGVNQRTTPTAARTDAQVTAIPEGKVKLWVMSDLRIERCPMELRNVPADFDALLVAGGVSSDLERSLNWLTKALDGRHGNRPVVLVPGNTEFWSGRPKGEVLRKGRSLATSLGITLLSDDTIRIDRGGAPGILIVGATLWTDWALAGLARAALARGYARHRHPDVKRITLASGAPYHPHDAAAANARSRAYIEDVLSYCVVQEGGFGVSPVSLFKEARPGDRAVVITHHAPTRRSIPARWAPDVRDEWIASSMASDMEPLMTMWGAPALWVHGHVGDPVDIRVGKTRVVANPRGSPAEGRFDPKLVLEV